MAARLDTLACQAPLMLIALWRLLLSPMLGPSCRFYPTCSHYAEEALRRRGLFMGLCLTLWRLARCHPISVGGFDPVPPARRQGEPRR